MDKKLERIVQNVYRNGYCLNNICLLQKFINVFYYDVIPRDVILCQIPQTSNSSKIPKIILFLYSTLKPPEGYLLGSKHAQNLSDANKNSLYYDQVVCVGCH